MPNPNRVAPPLAGNQRQLVSDQRPTIDQLILIQLARHARTLLPLPAVRSERI
jgi:hypothetical protein